MFDLNKQIVLVQSLDDLSRHHQSFDHARLKFQVVIGRWRQAISSAGRVSSSKIVNPLTKLIFGITTPASFRHAASTHAEIRADYD